MHGDGIPGQIYIEGEHRWMLPGVICPICVPWAEVGQEYPCIHPSKFQQKAFKRGPQPLEWYRDEFPKYEICAANGSLAKPGTTFGPMHGRVEHGRIETDFVWSGGDRTILVRHSLIQELLRSSLKLGGIEVASLKGRGKSDHHFGEIQVEPGLPLSPASFLRRAPDCHVCGRSPINLKDGMVKLVGATKLVPDLFRATNYATLIFATEKFRRFCVERKLSNIKFVPAGLSLV